MTEIATNDAVTMTREIAFTVNIDGEEWKVVLTAWSDGTHTVDASHEIDPWPVPLPRMLDEYEIDLEDAEPTLTRIVDDIRDAVEMRADSQWENFLSTYYGG